MTGADAWTSLGAHHIEGTADTWLTVAVLLVAVATLIVAGITLWFTALRPAKLVVDRLEELETSDLIFAVYPQPNPDGLPQVPGEWSFQLRVAVANVGGRKGVLSDIFVEHYTTKSGQNVYLPEGVLGPLRGMQWNMQIGWVGGERIFQNLATPGPWVLAADDAIVIQFRSKRGINWTERWDLPALKSYWEQLREPFVSVRVGVVWRQGTRKVRQHFEIPLDVVQQTLYVDALESLTEGFTKRPGVEPLPIQFE